MSWSQLPTESVWFLYKFGGMVQNHCVWQVTVLKVHHQVLVPFRCMSLPAWDPRVPDSSHRLGKDQFSNSPAGFHLTFMHLVLTLLHFTSCWLLLSHSIPRVSGDFVTNKLWDNGYLKLIRSVSKSCFGSSENDLLCACEEQCCSSPQLPPRLHLEK